VNGTFAAQVEVGALPQGGDGWAVAVADIDGDGDRDIYGMVGDERLVSNPNDIIWLRDGWTFTPVPVPPAGGLADDIVVVRPWRSGRVGLLVLNGYDKCCGAGAHERGPIALFHWNSG
jgi:FG-GAP-like repeat